MPNSFIVEITPDATSTIKGKQVLVEQATTTLAGKAATATGADFRAGIDLTKIVTPGVLRANMGFSEMYTTSEITLTSGGSNTFSHGLGTTARVIGAYLVCKTAANGYSVGDKIDTGFGNPTGLWGAAVRCNSTQLKVDFPTSATIFNGINPSTNVYDNFTNANYKLVVEVIG